MLREVAHHSGAIMLVCVFEVAVAHAQQSGTEVALPPVTVTATPNGSLTVPSVEQQHDQVLQTPGSVWE